MDDDNIHDEGQPIFGREAKIATVAFSLGVFLARSVYKHRMIPVRIVNARLKEMFTEGKIKTEDGGDVMLQFFHK